MNKTMKKILMRIGMLSLSAVGFWITYERISTGRIYSKFKFGAFITPEDHPRKFWFSIGLGVFFSVLFFICAFLKNEDD